MTKTYLEITLKIEVGNRSTAASVYTKYKPLFLDKIKGALSKELLIRDEDVQVLHGFDTPENAKEYMKSDIFNKDVVKELSPLLMESPEIKIYSVA